MERFSGKRSKMDFNEQLVQNRALGFSSPINRLLDVGVENLTLRHLKMHESDLSVAVLVAEDKKLVS